MKKMENKNYAFTLSRFCASVLLRFCALAFLICISPLNLMAESYFNKEAIGTTSADFLNLPIGARAAAMGGAYTAISEDASGIFWNPAGLVQI